MKKVQISFDENMLVEIDQIISTTDLSFPDIVRDAVRQWLKRREIRKIEKEWIEKLRINPESPEEAKKWLTIEYWSDNESW